jgi:hypothetical protein
MKNQISILLITICFLFCGFSTAYASGNYDPCDGYFGKLLNKCHTVIHPERKAPRGVGADILIHETKEADFFAEYRYDGKNEEHSIFGVVETKTSLVDHGKNLVSWIKGKLFG